MAAAAITAVAKSNNESLKEVFLYVFLQVIAEFSNLEAKDHLNMTSIHFACKHGHLDIVKFLISKKVYINPAALQGKY